MTVITRKCINPDIVLHRTDNNFNVIQSIGYEEFCSMVNFWKMFFVEQYNVKPGERAFIVGSPGYNYYGAIFAAMELGLVLILDWPHCYNEADLSNYKVSMFGTIDYVVYLDEADPQENIQWDQERNRRYARNVITLDKFQKYTIQDGTIYNKVSELICCSPDDIVVEYPSSGTTGNPKKITNTHKKIYLMSQRIARMFNFQPDDNILHLTNLNHGHALCLHFLPGFMTSQHQYSANPNNFTGLVRFIQDKQINRALLYTAKILLDFLNQTERLSHSLRILTLYQITPAIVKLIRKKNIAQINSTFGDTAIGAGFLLKTVTPNTELENYSPSNYGPKVDDFWEFDIRDGVLWVKSDALGQDWMTSNDVFDVIDSCYYFKGRSDSYKINDEWVVLADIEQAVRNAFYADANIAVDLEMQQIYLAMWKEDPVAENLVNNYFKQKYKNVRINYVIRDQKYDEFFNSRKIDNSKIRDYCRTQLGLK